MEKILIIQTAFIGDAILTLPMIQKLKVMFPESSIDVLTIPSTKEIFESSAFTNEIFVLDKRGKHKSIFATYKLAKEIKKKNYTRLYTPHRSLRTALLVMFTDIRETYGFDNSSLKHIYKNLVEYKKDHHEVRRNLDLIGYTYLNDDWKVKPEVEIPINAKNKIKNFLNSVNYENLAAIAPGSVWNTKIYPLEYYEKIIEYLVSKSFKALIIGSDKDKKVCEDLSSKFNDSVISTAGEFSLIESIELLKRSEVLITNDSAPTHMAMAAGIPVITIYCSTVPEFGFYPYNSRSFYLSFDDLFCKPCGIHGYEECPIKTFDCGYKLLPERVIKKIDNVINAE